MNTDIKTSLLGKGLSPEFWRIYKAIASDKQTKNGRPQLDCVMLNSSKMIVTNGSFLIEDSKPVDCDISDQALRPLGNNKSLFTKPIISETPCTSDNSCTEKKIITEDGQVEVLDCTYPDYVSALQLNAPITFKVALNAKYLKRISDYVNKKGGQYTDSVTLEFRGVTGPITVTSYNDNNIQAKGYLMPMKLND